MLVAGPGHMHMKCKYVWGCWRLQELFASDTVSDVFDRMKDDDGDDDDDDKNGNSRWHSN